MPNYSFTDTVKKGTNTSAGSWASIQAGAGAAVTTGTGNTQFISDDFTGGTTYHAYVVFLAFDTSSIPDSEVVQSATLKMFGIVSGSANSGDEMRVYLTTSHVGGDWVTPANMTTLLASLNGASWSNSSQNTVTANGTLLADNIDKSGTTYMVVTSARVKTGVAPTDTHFSMGWQIGASGNYPTLEVTTLSSAGMLVMF